jgi:hypothetical protein
MKLFHVSLNYEFKILVMGICKLCQMHEAVLWKNFCESCLALTKHWRDTDALFKVNNQLKTENMESKFKNNELNAGIMDSTKENPRHFCLVEQRLSRLTAQLSYSASLTQAKLNQIYALNLKNEESVPMKEPECFVEHMNNLLDLLEKNVELVDHNRAHLDLVI